MPFLALLFIFAMVSAAASRPRRKSLRERILDRIRDFFTPAVRLDLGTLSPLERLVIQRHTGGTMRRRSGRRLTLADYRRAMEEAASDERRLGELCDALRHKLSREEAHRQLADYSRRGGRP